MPFEEPVKVEKTESISDNTMTCSNKIRHSSATTIIRLERKKQIIVHVTEEEERTILCSYIFNSVMF